MSGATTATARRIKYRESLVIRELAAGKPMREAIAAGGWGSWAQSNPTTWLNDHPGVAEELSKLTSNVLLDAEELLQELIHQLARLTDQAQRLHGDLGHDIAEIYASAGVLHSVQDWPEVWRRRLIVEIESREEFGRSQDGGESSWDKEADIRKVKRESTLQIERTLLQVEKEIRETLELIARHKAVDAMATIKGSLDVNHNFTAEAAREISASKQRMSRIIDVKPETTISSGFQLSTSCGEVPENPQDEKHNI